MCKQRALWQVKLKESSLCSLKSYVKSAWEKRAVPIHYLRSDEMLTGLMSVSLFYRYFRNLLLNKSTLSCQILYCAGSTHSSIARVNAAPRCLSLQKLWACNSAVPTNHITVLRVLARKDLHEGMIFILFRSSFHVSLTVQDNIVYSPCYLFP